MATLVNKQMLHRYNLVLLKMSTVLEEHHKFNKEIVHQVGKQNYILLRCMVNSTLKKNIYLFQGFAFCACVCYASYFWEAI